MTLIIYYIGLIIAGTIGSILFSLWIEQMSANLSMTVFLVLYFLVLWLAWPLAVRLTAPKEEDSVVKPGVQPSRG
jgi:membrane protein implicated in regulation of membrane protease activity